MSLVGGQYETGSNGNDYLVGSNPDGFFDLGNDSLYGNDGHDDLYGLGGNDYLQGDEGDDDLYGGSGDDTLIGANPDYYGAGSGELDDLNGGSGADTFVLGDFYEAYYQGFGDALIEDFNWQEGDTLQLHDDGIGNPESDYSTYETSGYGSFYQDDTILEYKGDQIGILQDVSGSDFILSEDAVFV